MIKFVLISVFAVITFVFWDATKSPIICVPPGWQTMGKYWIDNKGYQCSHTKSSDWIAWIHPEEWG